ncbi:hypothetical protein CYMTET_39179 [Cymbomonas tetramitiformis]|uniref:Uncharacterized protein n=1 Tax=Cymbomonas tetramitiformis TaxID=36881 RepID=A0AAE0CCM0_9CHLO|nr:hypothetical protein CYMTET_39179 [Cymbomonas tetramitiformis]
MAQAEIILHTRDHPCPSDDTNAYCIDGTRLIDDLRRLKTSAKPRPAKNNLLWCACTKTKPNELAVFLSKNFTADWRSHCQIDANTKYVHVTPELAEFVARFATAHDVAEAIKTWVADGCVARNPELAVGRARATGNLGKVADVSVRTVENDGDAGVAVEGSPASNNDRVLIGSHNNISDAPTGDTIANSAVPSFNTTDVADPNAVTTDKSDLFADFAFTANTVKSRKLTTESGLKQTERGTTSTFVDLVNSDATADEIMVDATEPPSLEKVIDTTNTVTNGNADVTAVFDAANAPGAARATVTTLLPSQFEPDATVNENSVATVVLRERSGTEVAADVDVDDAIDSDDDELWISPAKHAEVALVYQRYSEGDVTLAKDILHRFDEANGTRTQSLVREGQAGADDEWVLHQADAELTRKRAQEEDDERQRTLAKARKLDDYELQEKECNLRRLQLELQQKEKEVEIRVAKLYQELETQKNTDAQELEIRKSKDAHDLRVHQFRDIKSAFESCLDIPGVGEAERGVYRAHIHNAVTEMSGNVSSALAIAPSAAPINVTVNNNNNPTNNTGITTAVQPCEVTPEELTWQHLWKKRGTSENPALPIASFLNDSEEPRVQEYRDKMRAHINFINTFGTKLATSWRAAHDRYHIPEQSSTVQNVQTGIHASGCKQYYEADRPLMRQVADEQIRAYDAKTARN